MSRALFAINVFESGQVETTAAPDVAKPLKIHILRASIISLTAQCRNWDVEFLDLLSPLELEELRQRLEARR